ncbi:MAG: carotenoid biosynthesis protein [Chloroflexota bacterium]
MIKKLIGVTSLPGYTVIPVLIWLAVFLSLPLVERSSGFPALLAGFSIGVMIQAALVVFLLVSEIGLSQTLKIVLLIAVLSFFTEYFGVTTGLPSGKYFYNAFLQPQIGNVPLLIPLAWLMMLPPSWAIGNKITGRPGRSRVFILCSALAFTARDIFLDP